MNIASRKSMFEHPYFLATKKVFKGLPSGFMYGVLLVAVEVLIRLLWKDSIVTDVGEREIRIQITICLLVCVGAILYVYCVEYGFRKREISHSEEVAGLREALDKARRNCEESLAAQADLVAKIKAEHFKDLEAERLKCQEKDKELAIRKGSTDLAKRLLRHVSVYSMGVRKWATSLNDKKALSGKVKALLDEYRGEVCESLKVFKSGVTNVNPGSSLTISISGLYFWIVPSVGRSLRREIAKSVGSLVREYIVVGDGVEDISIPGLRESLNKPPPGLLALVDGPFASFDRYHVIFTKKAMHEISECDYDKLDLAGPILIICKCGQAESISIRDTGANGNMRFKIDRLEAFVDKRGRGC